MTGFRASLKIWSEFLEALVEIGGGHSGFPAQDAGTGRYEPKAISFSIQYSTRGRFDTNILRVMASHSRPRGLCTAVYVLFFLGVIIYRHSRRFLCFKRISGHAYAC